MSPRFALVVALAVWQMGLLGSLAPTHASPIMTAALRLHDAPEACSTSLTVRDAYRQFVLPSLGGASRKTVTQFTTVIGLWESFCEPGGITTSNPAPPLAISNYPVDAVHDITDAMLDDWARWLMAEIPTRAPSRYAKSTVETYAKKLRTILKVLGPRESGNKRGANVLSFVPAMAPVGDLCSDESDAGDESIDLADDDIGRIYEACDVASWPDDEAALEWKTFVVILAMLGPRVNDGATMKPSNFRSEPRSPIRHSPREHAHGWLDYVQEKTGKRVIVPLPMVVRTHVDALLKLRNHDRLFSWHDSKSKTFADQWNAIVAQAGLGHVKRKHFRPTANLRWTLAANDREVGAMVLGHSAADVNAKHYTRNEALLCQHVEQVAAPPAFCVDPSTGPKQLFLF
jgi:integrase